MKYFIAQTENGLELYNQTDIAKGRTEDLQGFEVIDTKSYIQLLDYKIRNTFNEELRRELKELRDWIRN